MSAPEHALYAMPAMRALSRAEGAAVAACLPSRAGSYGLRLGMHECACPDAVAHWVHLCRHSDGWDGDLRAQCGASLPFAADSFAVVWLSQVLQFHGRGEDLLNEAQRIVAPGGLLLLSGIHPFSAWAPWLAWTLRDARVGWRWPGPARLANRLARLGFEVESVQRFGSALPRSSATGHPLEALGGGYALKARKRQDAVTPLRPRPLRRTAPAPAPLAPGAHRECA